MRTLNYKHLLYFHTVAAQGSVQKAAERLNVTPQTISGQLKQLEDDLKTELFAKSGRGLTLTDSGQLAFDYTKQIFQLGEELQEVMYLGVSNRPTEFRVGIVDALPKSIVYQLLKPALALPGEMRIVCHEEPMSTLLGELAVHELDLVLADSPIPSGMNIRCFNHLLGRSPLACFATPELAKQYADLPFPKSLHQAPVLLPTDPASGLRTQLLSWLNQHSLSVIIAGEFDDSALLKTFGSQGLGYFFAPDVIREEICQKYQVVCVGLVHELVQEFYALSADRRISHQGVQAITGQQQFGL